jgi:hypothetical protein
VIQRALGVASVILGLLLAAWVAYNLLVERGAHFQGSPLVGLLLFLVFLRVGFAWIRGRIVR